MSSWAADSGALENAMAPCAAVTTSAMTSFSLGIEVQISQGLAGLLSLEPHWNALAERLPDASFYHAYEWHLSYLRNLDDDTDAVHYFTYFRDESPVAIFPLRRSRRTVALLPLWVWEFPFNPHINLCDCLISPQESPANLCRLLIGTLNRLASLPWDALHLPNLINESTALKMLRSAASPRTLVTKCGESMYFPCDDFDTAMRNNSGQFKRNLRRQQKKLEQRGEVTISIVQDKADLKQAFEEFLRVEASGWKGDCGHCSAIALDPRRIQFYRDLLDCMAGKKRCLISLLKLNGVVIASQFGLISGTTLNLLKIAYDETHNADAPGSLLLHAVLKHCCASDSIRRLSLVTGPAWASSRWKPEASDVWTGYIFNSTLRGLAAYNAKRLRFALARSAKAKVGDPPRGRTDVQPLPSGTAERKSPKSFRLGSAPRCQLQNHLSQRSLWRRMQIAVRDWRQRLHLRTRLHHRGASVTAVPDRLGKPSRFVAGTWVRIRSAEQIFATLNGKKQLRGLLWVWQQWPYCDTTHRVFKPVRRILDDANRIRPVSGTVLLDTAPCGGPHGQHGCGRECPLMFRDEWLEAVPPPEPAATPSEPRTFATVRSADEIKRGLDGDHSRDGLMFMPEMFKYVNRRFPVFRKVESVLDGGRNVPASPALYLLDGLHCTGAIVGNDGPCDRGCRLLWHPDWLRLDAH